MADSTPDEDFLDGSAADYPAYAAADADADAVAPRMRRRLPAAVVTAAWVVVGLVVGVVAVAVWHSGRDANASGVPAAVGNQQPAAGGFARPGSGVGGFDGRGPADGRFGGGGRDGEQHVFGTLTAVGKSSITVRTDAGSTTTYRIDSSTQLVKDGQQVSSLSAMHVGDQVVVHVYPLNGTTHVERVLDGVPPGGFGGPPPGRPGGDATTTTTAATTST
jgi:hypothetical protein